MAEASEALGQCFRRYQNRGYSREDDDNLKLEGQKILDKHAPQKKKKSKINSDNIFWMVSSIAVFYYTDFYIAIRMDPDVDRYYLNPGLIMLSISTVIASYLIGYYHYYKGISDYEKHVPFAVPLATMSFIAGMICICIALWPLWNLFTPLILFTLFMGFVVLITLIPI